ncbi:hypothetical protein P692DRAFT_20759351 [Suillus brevipes Sb2]|nr:hypothetical protein P692DRAFT_20759351 [Suillus brevipes Sb2]
MGLNLPTANAIDTQIKRAFDAFGLSVKVGTQRIFYQSIRKFRKKPQERRKTTANLALTIYAIKELNGNSPSPACIWKAVRNLDIPKNIRGFLWKNLHEAYKIGDFWLNVPNYENRGNCPLCGETESMPHILLECEKSTAIVTVWKAASTLWNLREESWPTIKYGTILGSNLVKFKDEEGKNLPGKNRLFNIIVTESAHLLWKLRCERTIKFDNDAEKYHSEREIYNRWLSTMNRRLKLDRILTDKNKFGRKAIDEKLVLRTWSGTLDNEENLPDNWCRQSGVLVGMAPLRPPGRNR